MRKVAIVSTSFRMPGTTPACFWDDLLGGRDLVTEVDADRFGTAAYLHPNKNHPGTTYTFAAGSIGDISGFDAGFFAISPREASLMDPQQRLLLEMSWETFENAGIRPSTLRGSECGVYLGIATVDYSWRFTEDVAAVDSAFSTGNASSIAANRLSYFYDLRGPSMAVDTACSSSLVAFHLACRAIVAGEINQALTGAISLHMHPLGFVSFSKANMLSPRGRCRVFDASADGYVRSEGGGLFFLKDYDRAVIDGDPILAVVVNSAVNTDGHKSGLTVPSAAAQTSLLVNAYAQAGVEPWEIDYIEAHGTGTAVGDPIETRAIGEALGRYRPKSDPLPIGSVKGNVGHLEAASGIAGLVKVLHCLRHRGIPAHIGMITPNPHIPFNDLNLEVITENKPLRSSGRLVIGVNSFGFGGANAHVILESHDAQVGVTPVMPKSSPLPIVVSARDATALKSAARALSKVIEGLPRSSLYDVAYQSVFGRERQAHCAVLFGRTPASIAKTLQEFAAEGSEKSAVEYGTALAAPMGTAFIYSGNGSQWAGMGRTLLADPTFRAAVREVDTLFSLYADYSLEQELAGNNGDGRYQFTEIAQPALFALQVGITAMLRRRGLMPVAVAGHSVGEVAAAWAAGSLSLAAAVSVIHHRSALQGTTKGWGGMTAVNIGESSARELLRELRLTEKLHVAGVNSKHGVTIAGAAAELDCLEAALATANIVHKRLDLDYAFHSPAMEGLFPELRRGLAHLEPAATELPLYSTVTGECLDGKSLNAEYWWQNVRQPVLFEKAITRMAKQGINIFLEIGPHAVLRRYIQDCLGEAGVTGRVLATGMRDDDSPQRIYSGLSQALIAGATMDWKRLLPWRGRHIRLPNYPWQREAYWHEVTPSSMGLIDRKNQHPLLGYRSRQMELTWENSLDTLRLPTLADHVVGGACVFPGAGFAELALAAAERWQPTGIIEIEDLEIRTPLLLDSETSRTLRCTLDPQDGQLSIKSREELRTEPWTLHAVARALREPTDIRLSRILGVLPTRPADFTASSHSALALAAGLEYGPAFQAVTHGWVDEAAVLAVLEVPACVRGEFDRYHLHPSLLDCAFQLIIHFLHDRDGGVDDVAYVPTRIEHLSFRQGILEPKYARARLMNRGPHSLCVDVEIFDEAQQPIAVLERVRFRALRLQRGATPSLRYFEYVGVPRPLIAPAPNIVGEPFARLEAALEDCMADPAVKQAHRVFTCEIDPLLNELCSRFVSEVLQRMPAPAVEAAAYHDRLIWLAGMRDASDTGPEVLGSAHDIWNGLLGDYPDQFAVVHAVGCVGLHLPELLGGRRALASIQPSQVSLPALLRQARGVDFNHRIDNALREQIIAAQEELPEGRRLGVIEISEGPPTFAASICRGLDFDRADYGFVSNATASLEEARRLQEKYPRISVAGMDDDSACGACQLAILILDFQALSGALRALELAQSRLAIGGKLLIVGHHPTQWLDFVFGGDPAWWSVAPDGTSMSRQRPAEFWQQSAAESGSGGLRLFQHDDAMHTGGYLLVGTKHATNDPLPARSPARQWLVLADHSGYSANLARALAVQLSENGDAVAVTPSGEAPSRDGVHEIIDLRGLSPLERDAEAASLFDGQVARCAAVGALIKDCESVRSRSRYCFVTANAATHLLPPRPNPGRHQGASLADAPVAGLARTLMNEAANCTVRWVDLETSAAIDVTAAALCRELILGGDEQEVIITAAGERYAPRLRPAITPQSDEIDNPANAKPSSVRLRLSQPGHLRNLQWSSHPIQTPAGDDVEISVRATGLNFRDVMYSLGLLSDEAVENGFAGSSLGMEFSGVISRVGPDAMGFAPGDAVVGFAPSSFGERVVTRSLALSKIPAGLSFEAAATIPSAFFTAYYALHHVARLGYGETVLIHGAAGGVGLAAVQVAKWCGAEVYATAGSEEKRDFLRLLGVDRIFDSRKLDFADEILALSGGAGVDVVLNSLAGEAINRNLHALKPFGRFLELGKRDFYENTRMGLRPFRNNLSYFGIDADQLMSERPDLTQRLFTEMLALFETGILRPLPFKVFDAADVVDAFRHMQQARHIGKIVVTYRNGIQCVHAPRSTGASPQPPRRLELSPHSSFLVTGGLSGFGLRTAEWLADRGARHLVLVSRRGATTDEAETVLARLERRGVQVTARSCDITDRSALVRLFADISRDLPPLRGIVHAAAVIEDALMRDADVEQIRRVLAPKSLGAQHLHELTRHMELDFFVLYSSASTLFGNPGQGSYVAANFALEALARERRAQGLPATCVRWGAIEDVGFLARNPKIKEALQGRMGGSALQSSVALDALEAMLVCDRSDLGVLDLDWRALSRSLPSSAASKFAEISQAAGDVEADEQSSVDIRSQLNELPEEELLEVVIDLLKVEIGEILRMAPEKIDATLSVHQMGLDSLMGVELVVAVENRFGARLPVMALSDSPTIAKLAVWIIRQLRGDDGAAGDSTQREIHAQIAKVSAQHAADLPQDAIEQMADQLLSGKPAANRRIIQT